MTTPTRPAVSADDLHQMLLRWQADGLLDATEVAAIEAAESARRREAAARVQGAPAGTVIAAPAARPSGSLIAEALGYAGGALMIVALAVLVGRSWDRLAFGAQVGLLATAAVALFGAGLLVPSRMDAAGRRLQAVLWVVSTGLAFGAWILVSGPDGFAWDDRDRMLIAGALAAAQAALLWWRSGSVLLHLATFASLAVVVAGAGQYLAFLHDKATATGLAVCVFAAVWVLLGLRDIVTPAMTAYLVGTFVAVNAAQATTSKNWGAVLALVIAGAVIAFAVWKRSLALLAVGTYGLLSAVGAATDKFFPDSMAMAFGLLVAGAVLIACALWITRRGRVTP